MALILDASGKPIAKPKTMKAMTAVQLEALGLLLRSPEALARKKPSWELVAMAYATILSVQDANEKLAASRVEKIRGCKHPRPGLIQVGLGVLYCERCDGMAFVLKVKEGELDAAGKEGKA